MRNVTKTFVVEVVGDLVTRCYELCGALAAANGRRRVRTLDWRDVLECCMKAVDDREGWYWASGGTVPAAYEYPAAQTACVVAVRSDGRLRVGIARVSARKGASPTTRITGLARNAKPEAFRAWADAEE